MTTFRPQPRFWALLVLISLAFAGLGCRLVYLQVFQYDYFAGIADRTTMETNIFKPRRGNIRDIRGNLLATSVPVKTVWADPSLIGDRQLELARILAPRLGLAEDAVVRALQVTLRTNAAGKVVTNQYKTLKRDVPLETWLQITQSLCGLSFGVDESRLSFREQQFFRNLRTRAIRSDDEQRREYPSQTLASHVLGYVGIQRQKVCNEDIETLVGLNGIESTMNQTLQGIFGWRVFECDSRKCEVGANRDMEVAVRHGSHVVLTLDSRLQDIVESELAVAVLKHPCRSATAVMVRPRTGEILALANWPTYDPNHLGTASLDTLKNRVIVDSYEPGSTFKIVVISAALNERKATLDELIDCENGRFIYHGKPLREHESHGYGLLSVAGIAMKSSNIGAAKLGLRLGPETLYAYVRAFGFDSLTGIYLPAEATGLLAPPKKWDKLTITRLPMGHAVTVTPLQMTMAMAAIANGGRLMQPMIVARVEDANGKILTQYAPRVVRPVITEETAKLMVTALKGVVSTNGTGAKARLSHYTVAGKTGTAEKYGSQAGQYYASFVGFFPADSPEVCLAVAFDEPDPKFGRFGGVVAAPVFQAIAERTAAYLGLPPNIMPTNLGSAAVGSAAAGKTWEPDNRR